MENLTKRLRWGCRRGILELDILLEDFLDRQFSLLSATEQSEFEKLLLCADQDLFDWLLGTRVPVEPRLNQLVKKIRIQSSPDQ